MKKYVKQQLKMRVNYIKSTSKNKLEKTKGWTCVLYVHPFFILKEHLMYWYIRVGYYVI